MAANDNEGGFVLPEGHEIVEEFYIDPEELEGGEGDDAAFFDDGDVAEEILLDDDPEDGAAGFSDESGDGDVDGGEGGEGGEGEEDPERPRTPPRDDSVARFLLHDEAVLSVRASPADPDLVVSGGCDDKAHFWRISDPDTIVHTVDAHTDSVVLSAFDASGTYVATGGMDGLVCVTEVDTFERTCLLEGPDEVTSLAWHPKGPVVLAGSEDATVWMWSIPKGTTMQVFAGHAAPVTCVAFTPDGKKVVTSSEDATIRVWDPMTAAVDVKLEGDLFHAAPIATFAINEVGSVIASGGYDGNVNVAKLESGKSIGNLDAHREFSVEAIGWCTTHPFFATGSIDGKICVWDSNTLQLRTTMAESDSIVRLAWHPDSPLLFTASNDGLVHLWDARTGDAVQEFSGHRSGLLDLFVAADGNRLLTAGDDMACLVFDINAL